VLLTCIWEPERLAKAVPYRLLTTAQIQLVRRSYDSIRRREFAEIFYRRFFELAPETRTLFPRDLEGQYLALMNMLAAIVGALDEREVFQSMTTYAGLQHAQFGAKRAHFRAFGEALLWCLEQQLDPSPELRAAWVKLYDAVRKKMIIAAKRAA
jgi:hemoglobin-like flavoprotein